MDFDHIEDNISKPEGNVSPGYSASIDEHDMQDFHSFADADGGLPDPPSDDAGGLQFRAIDLIGERKSFSQFQLPSHYNQPEPCNEPGTETQLFGPPGPVSEFAHETEANASVEIGSEDSVEVVERDLKEQSETLEEPSAPGPLVSQQTWNELGSHSFGQFRQIPNSLLYPWEQGPMAAIFDFDADPLPQCLGLAEDVATEPANSSDSLQRRLTSFLLPDDAKYINAVKSIQDMNYFDNKSQQLELACSQWLRILSVQWSASGVGPQLVAALQKDSAGAEACMILKACFGVKSPSTLLKRASAFRKFYSWFDKSALCNELNSYPLPLEEAVVWEYFLFLRQQRDVQSKGYTVPSSFMEAVRFAKFTLDLQGTDSILCSRRLLGLAALERKAKGPTVQAPGLDPEHIRRLHEVLHTSSNMIDKLGAGCFLICLYGRARWSDMRYINHVQVEEGEFITCFTTEHKTASVGLRREQYLPIVVPWNGICNDEWVREWLDVYLQVGLDIDKRPLGPLLPAPRIDGSFCARPLTTPEAAAWLRGLLQGTSNWDSFRSHSLKATLLTWCARAGFDKETRAVLGHHCSAVSGSEVVYSRQLQTRALRKLALVLRRVKAGLNIEDEAMKKYGIISTPARFTPLPAARTPVAPVAATALQSEVPQQDKVDKMAVDGAVASALQLEEVQSVKEEDLSQQTLELAASELTLFPVEVVSAGIVEIESSSGSESSSSSSEYDSSSSEDIVQAQGPQVVEHVPEGIEYYRHVKSGLVHSCTLGQAVAACKIQMNANFKKLAREIHVVHPKCIRCFPKNNNRIRSLEQLTGCLDGYLKKYKAAGSKDP